MIGITRAQIMAIICALVILTKITRAQITMSNNDLEGTPCITWVGGNIDTFEYLNYCPLPDFFQCDSFIAIVDAFIYNPPNFYPAFPHSGQTCLMISDVSNTLKGTVTTVLSCSLKKNKKYLLKYWAANLFNLEAVPKHQTLSIWGYADTCVKVEQIWESEHIDTGWHQYTATLTPQQQDYEYIHFRIGVRDSVSRHLLLDSLSDIYPFNGNDVAASIQDTAFTKANSTCIALNATANITTYDTAYWQDAAGNKIAEGFNGGIVCPGSSTYYVIAMRDSVPDCAGYWWSYDTVTVTINTGTAVVSPDREEALGVNIFPNPAIFFITLTYSNNKNLAYEIINLLGQSVTGVKQLNNNGKEQINTSGINEGIYLLKVYGQGNTTKTVRVIIQK